MIDMKDYPTSEDFLEGIQRCTAMCRETLSDIEYLSKKYISGEFFMLPEEVAELLRTNVESIPKMPWYRTYKDGRPQRVYKKRDVLDYLESKRMN